MADAIRGNQNIERFRETQTMRAAVLRGDAARAGAAEHRESVTQDEGPATVVRSEELPQGRMRMEMSDGRLLTRAGNGVLKEEEPNGTTRWSLPNGILIQREADGGVAGYDPRSGKELDVRCQQRNEAGQLYFTFDDASGASWLATGDTLRFEVWNPSGTVRQSVHANGAMLVGTCTVRRDAQTGEFRQDEDHVQIRPDGTVHGHGLTAGSIELTNKRVRYTQPDGVHLEMDLAYPIPFELQAGGKPQAPPAGPPPVPPTPDEPQAPRPTPGAGSQPGAGVPPGAGPQPGPGTPPGAGVPPGADWPQFPPGWGMPPEAGIPPGAGMPPCPPGMGMPPGAGMPPYPPGMGMPPGSAFPPGMIPPGYQVPWGTGIPPNVPWEVPPFAEGFPPPSQPLPSDPYATVTTANGIIRQAQPDGSMFISLPSKIVVAQGPNGIPQVFDPRTDKPLPVTVQDVNTPGGGAEKQYDFRDAAGNAYTMYSKSLDFVATSADGKVRQVVLPQGNVLTMVQVPGVGPDGKPTVQVRMAEILPGGQVNTFGDPAISLGLDRIMVGSPGQPPVTLPLPYPIQQTQGMIGSLRAMNPFYASATSGLNPTPGATAPTGSGFGSPWGSGPLNPQDYAGAWGTPGPTAPPPTPEKAAGSAAPPPAPQAGPKSTAEATTQATTAPAAAETRAPEVTPQTAAATPPEAMTAPPQDPMELMGAIMGQVRHAGLDARSCEELEGLLPKVLTGAATPEEQARADALVQAAVTAKAQAGTTSETGAAAEAPASEGAPEARAARTAPSESASSPAPAPDRPQLQPEQVAMVDNMMEQVTASNPPASLVGELRPLLERIVANVATPEDVQRADALVQAAMAGGATESSAPPSSPAAAVGAPVGAQQAPPASPASPASVSPPPTAADGGGPAAGATPGGIPAAGATAAATSGNTGLGGAEPVMEAASAASAKAGADAQAGAGAEAGAGRNAEAGAEARAAEEPKDAGEAKPESEASAARGPHKPGVWQKIKDFFTRDTHHAGSAGWSSWNAYGWGNGWNPYPHQVYNPNPFAPYASMQGILAANLMATTFMGMAMMPSMYYWNPCGMWGTPMYGYPAMW